jgi:hypothetical protein
MPTVLESNPFTLTLNSATLPTWRVGQAVNEIRNIATAAVPTPLAQYETDGSPDYCGLEFVPTLGSHGSILSTVNGGHSGNEVPTILRFDLATGITSRINDANTPRVAQFSQANGSEISLTAEAGFSHAGGGNNGNRWTYFGAPGWPSVTKWTGNAYPKDKITYAAARGPANPWPQANHSYNTPTFVPQGVLGLGALGGLLLPFMSSVGGLSGTHAYHPWLYDINANAWRVLDELGPPSYYAGRTVYPANGAHINDAGSCRWMQNQPNDGDCFYCADDGYIYAQPGYDANNRAVPRLRGDLSDPQWEVLPGGVRNVYRSAAAVVSNQNVTIWVEYQGGVLRWCSLRHSLQAEHTWSTATTSGAALPAFSGRGLVMRWIPSLSKLLIFGGRNVAGGFTTWPANTIALVSLNLSDLNVPWNVEFVVGTGGSFRDAWYMNNDNGLYRKMFHVPSLGGVVYMPDFSGTAQFMRLV